VAERTNRTSAAAASLGLHLLVVGALVISWRFAPPLARPITVTPVTLVANAPDTNVRAAAQAPEEHQAAAPEPAPPAPTPPAPVETPTPEPKPAPPPPTPEPPQPVHKTSPPKPAPKPEPKPAPQPKPQPKAAPKPTPELDLDSLSKAARKPQPKPLDLSALSKSQAKQQALNLADLAATPTRSHSKSSPLDLSALADSPAGGHRASAAKGPPRVETARVARQAAGAATGLDANALGALQAKVIRLWHPNCGVEGATGVTVKVRIRLGSDHSLVGQPTILSMNSSGASQAVVQAAAQRAVVAVAQGAPYDELPPTAPSDIILVFNARQACEG
jgi:outer membrane biosynthesis protein TonB